MSSPQFSSPQHAQPLPLCMHTKTTCMQDAAAAYLDELVDGTDAPPGQLRQQDHALNAIVLQQAHIGTHLRNLGHLLDKKCH
eukprot:scaffold25142_cov26-Tisochrysis_lutea.AAC.1